MPRVDKADWHKRRTLAGLLFTLAMVFQPASAQGTTALEVKGSLVVTQR